MADFLKVSDLSVSFGGIRAIDNLSFSLAPNSFLGLMGPNGAGKTTVINCLSGIYTPSSGKIFFKGNDLLSLHSHQYAGLGISRTFQDLNFFRLIPDMTVIDYVRLGQFGHFNNSILSEGLQLKRSRAKEKELIRRTHRILEWFRDLREEMEPSQDQRGYPFLYGKGGFADLIDVEYQPIDSLSFAWRRKLDLARALVGQPMLLLLDEPAQGLPLSEIENLGKTLKKIRSEFKVSALVVEHNVNLLMDSCDEIVVMNSGRKIAQGKPEEVRGNPEVIEIYLGKVQNHPQDSIIEESKFDAQTSSDEPVLSVKALDLYYGQAQALFSISLDLYPRQVAAVLGTNGSGKSTLLKAISGIEKPTFGEIQVNGSSLPLGWPEFAAKRGIQYVPQGHVIFPQLTVYDNLRVGSFLPSKKPGFSLEKEINHILNIFPPLRDLLDIEATKLSGGQQQMLAIAQALMAKPKILLLDEPSLGLAPVYVDSIFSIIKKISHEERCAILLVEQNVSKALEISDYIYMLNAGIMTGRGSKKLFKADDSIIFKSLGF